MQLLAQAHLKQMQGQNKKDGKNNMLGFPNLLKPIAPLPNLVGSKRPGGAPG